MMSNFDEANALLMGSGGAAVKFDNVGDTVVGHVVDAQPRQDVDFRTKLPSTWEDGRPKMILVVTLQTDEQDSDEDDGMRKVYARGAMLQAINAAVRRAGVRGLAYGGKLGIKFTGTEPTNMGSPKKLYSAKYEPPVEMVSIPDDNGDDSELPF
jgi:hypothetical protein